ncbi:MAG: dihydrodipicolinate synthase family protein, partial [Synechococcus sp.]|nr:dihydrodipicolinate synthase family protein [Synechococcus sp.]
MVTPFRADGDVDLDLAARLADHLVAHGSDGLVLCGTTGESPTLSWTEQHELFAAVKGAVGGRAKLIAGSGSNCTAEAVEATREAAELGADGALVVVPYYNKPPQDGLEAHFRAVAAAAPELPLMLYNIPGRTGTSLEPTTTARLLACPNVLSFKAASGSTEEVSA